MGLFSSSKKTVVSSVIYNMAGAIEDRIQYLSTAVVGAVVSKDQTDVADVVVRSLLQGPGIKLRSYARWGRLSNYKEVLGMGEPSMVVGDSIDEVVIAGQIPAAPGQTVTIQSAEISDADYSYWVDQWLLDNHPDRLTGDYLTDFDEINNIITIAYTDSTIYTFTPTNYDYQSKYLYVSYIFTSVNESGPLVPGDEEFVPTAEDLPDTADWTNQGTTTTSHTVDLDVTVTAVSSFSDARPDETTTSTTTSSETYDDVVTTWTRSTYQGAVPITGDIVSLEETMYQYVTGYVGDDTSEETTTETIEGGVTKTTVTTTVTESVKRTYSYKIDSFTLTLKKWSPLQILIYKKESGNPVLDTMFNPPAEQGSFFPFIPLRQDNVMVDASYPNQPLYEMNVKAFKRATNSKYGKILASLEDNPSLGDIDFAFAEFGVSLNTKEKAGIKYIYLFLQNAMQQAGDGLGGYNAWKVQFAAADAMQRQWLVWKDAQSNPLDPLFGTPEPTITGYPPLPQREFRISSIGEMNYDMRVGWTAITENIGSGLGRPGAKMGDLWILAGGAETYEQLVHTREAEFNRTRTVEFTSVIWQDSPNTYRTLGIRGLTHGNYIYRGKGVITSAHEALADTEESGFVIPLHEDIYKQMSLKDATQLSTACCYIVLNCYERVKTRWYQQSWFKVVIIIVAIVITVVTMGGGAGASAGLLGTAASVGAALGFAGAVAILVGTIANAIAAMILTQLIMAGSTALFGEKVGMVVGTFASFVAVAYGSGQLSGGMSNAMSNMGSAESLMKLTMSAGKGYMGYIEDSTMDTVAKTQKMIDEYESASKEVATLYEKNVGYFNATIDPLALTEVDGQYIPESSTAFLQRSLLCGSDVAESTNSMIANFVNMALTSDLPA